MKICVVKMAPYSVNVGSHEFCLKSSKSIICNVSSPCNGIIEFSIDGLRDSEWYEADKFDKEQFDEFLEDSDEEIAYDESLEENCNLQSTMLEDATNKCDNLTPKEAKTLAENANALNEMSSNLAQSGVDKVKNTVLNG